MRSLHARSLAAMLAAGTFGWASVACADAGPKESDLLAIGASMVGALCCIGLAILVLVLIVVLIVRAATKTTAPAAPVAGQTAPAPAGGQPYVAPQPPVSPAPAASVPPPPSPPVAPAEPPAPSAPQVGAGGASDGS